jgi:adenylylsulfate reductase subunit B
VVPLGASVQPLRSSDSILWSIKFRNGNLKRFKFPIRTTAEGSADPTAGKGNKSGAALTDCGVLFTEDAHDGDTSQFMDG